MAAYKSRYFEKDSGARPVEEFVDSLKPKEKAVFIKKRKKYLEGIGPTAPENVIHRVEEFYQMQWLTYRVLCFLQKDEFLMLHAFKKKTNATRKIDIQRARSYKDIELARQNKTKTP